jgi:hypothetical protein
LGVQQHRDDEPHGVFEAKFDRLLDRIQLVITEVAKEEHIRLRGLDLRQEGRKILGRDRMLDLGDNLDAVLFALAFEATRQFVPEGIVGDQEGDSLAMFRKYVAADRLDVMCGSLPRGRCISRSPDSLIWSDWLIDMYITPRALNLITASCTEADNEPHELHFILSISSCVRVAASPGFSLSSRMAVRHAVAEATCRVELVDGDLGTTPLLAASAPGVSQRTGKPI